MTDYRFKVLLLGEGSVGKTSLLYQFVKGKFSSNYQITIGANFLSKDVQFSKKNEANLVIWDIAGQYAKFERFHKQFYKNANGALIVFDLTRPKTFDAVDKWHSEMEEILGKDVPFVLIGNKADLIGDFNREIDVKASQDYAESRGSIYIETSAKTGENVEDAFLQLTRKIAGMDPLEEERKQKRKKKRKWRR